jgi:hypothetical protein
VKRFVVCLTLMSCVGGIELDVTCDAVCLGTLQVTLADPVEFFGLEIVAEDFSLQVDCPTGEADVVVGRTVDGLEATCEDGAVTLTAVAHEWPDRATFEVAGASFELDVLTTPNDLCSSTCVDGAVTLPEPR